MPLLALQGVRRENSRMDVHSELTGGFTSRVGYKPPESDRELLLYMIAISALYGIVYRWRKEVDCER
jgi:hypothetical protein